MAKHPKKPNVPRLFLQWSIVGLLAYMVVRWWVDKSYTPDFETYCPFGGLQALTSWGVLNSLACSMTSLQITMGLTLLLAAVVFSKLFCGFLCPVGIFSEWLGLLGKKSRLRYSFTGWADRLLRLPKYLLLFVTFYFTVGSSELFCRQYDPFYAAFTGFSGDVVLWYALPALIITILGGIFFRLFWCKYLCPLGAMTNIFRWFVPFILVMGLFFGLRLAGVDISWIWPLALLTGGGYLFELWKMESRTFPLFKITRHDEACTHCNLCTKACPQGIDVMKVDKVRHIDCNLCAQCVVRCPEKGALRINGKSMTWFPAGITVLLVVAGILLGMNMVQIPTVDERWGSEEQMKRAAVYEQEGIKEIKCFGSSRSFVERMRPVDGILGVATYVGKRAVKILYDPSRLTPEKIRELIFTPVKYLIAIPDDTSQPIATAQFGIDRFFDRYDANNLESLLDLEEGLYGLETSFGEPVRATLFFDPRRFNPDRIKSIIETKELTLGEGENAHSVPLDFKLAPGTIVRGTVEWAEFGLRMFTPYSNTFNEYEKADQALIRRFELPAPQMLDPRMDKWIPYLESHISQDPGIVGWETFLKENQAYIRLIFLPDRTNPDGFIAHLNADSLDVKYNTGEKGRVDNPYRF